eukprot:Skav204651  [mRNA]  locus=scaffold949:89059:93092:- [translate_table: standard]
MTQLVPPGSVSFASGNFKNARKNFEKALLIRTTFGRENPTVACSAHALGSLYARMPRRQEDAIALLGKAASIRKEQLGEDSVHLADTLHELGSAIMVRQSAQSLQQALAYLSQAAAIREEKLGKRNAEYAASMHQLGQVHLHLGLASEAVLYLQAALSLRETLLGRQSAQAAASKAALGVACANNGDLEKGFKLLKATYKYREKLFGPNHALSADVLHQIGLVMIRQKKLDASLAPLLQALKVYRKLNQDDVKARLEDSEEDTAALVQKTSERTKRVQTKRSRKGTKPSESADPAETEAKSSGFMAKVRTLAKHRLGVGQKQDQEDPERQEDEEAAKAAVAKQRARSKDAKDDDEDSEVCIEEIDADIRGCFAPRLANVMLTLADVYADLRDLAEAKYWLDRSACVREELFGSSSAELGEAMHHFGLLHRRLGSSKKALAYFRKALRSRERSCGYSHNATAETCEQLAQVLHDLGNGEEAGIFINKAVAIRESLPSTKQSGLQETLEKSHALAASGMEYDPVQRGETVPHISKRTLEEVCVEVGSPRTTASAAFAQGHCMSSARGSASEVEALRSQLEALTLRVEVLEEDLRELRGREQPHEVPVIDPADSHPEEAASTTSFEEVEPSRLETLAGPYPWSVREEAAREIGQFLRRSLAGQNRGTSGRSRLPNLQNRIYLVARDYQGTLYNPVRVEDRFYRVRALCQQGNDWGDSVFVGLPSQREAVLATRAAGLSEPESIPGISLHPRDFVIHQEEGHLDCDYRVGRYTLPESGFVVAVIAVAVVDGRLLACFPEQVWKKSAAGRLLPAKALSKAILCSVASSEESDRGSPTPDKPDCKVWVGLLDNKLEAELDFISEEPIAYKFSPIASADLLPFAVALVEVCQTHFVFATAESGVPVGQVPECPPSGSHQDDRIAALERGLAALHQSLEKMMGSQTSAPVDPAPAPKAVPLPPRRPSALRSNSRKDVEPTVEEKFPG